MGKLFPYSDPGFTAVTFIAVVVVFILIAACSEASPPAMTPPAPPLLAQVGTQSTITKEVTASVLISERNETGPLALGELAVAPQNVVVDLGESVNLTADAFFADGTPASNVDLVWTMADVRAGAIQSDGEFTASREPGEYPDAITVMAIQNTGEGFVHTSASVPVTVVGQDQGALLSQVLILPTEPTVLTGQLYRFRAVAYDEHGLVIPGVSYEWSINAPILGELNSIGYLSVSATAGKYIDGVAVTGRWNGVQVTDSVDVTVLDVPDWGENLTVQVLPPRFQIDRGENMQMRAVAINGLGELVVGTRLRWTMEQPIAGSVSGTGLFVAGPEPGLFTEAVKVEAIIPGENGVIHAVDFASVVVRGQRKKSRMDTVIVRPEAVKLGTGGRTILAARAVDAEGRAADNVATIWEVVTDGVGKIDQFGSFKASAKPGIYNSAVRAIMTQSLDGELVTKTATVDINITGTLTDVIIEPDVVAVVEGGTVNYSAVGFDENGLIISGLLVRWRLADSELGTIDPMGNFTANPKIGLHTDAIIATIIQTITD